MNRRLRLRVDPLERGIPALVAGLAAGVVPAVTIDLAAGFLVGWAVAALVYSVWALVVTWRLDAERTRYVATAEAPGRKLVIAQSLLGYLFGAVILAAIINLVSGLGS